jgi:asparaginyl-tRNA synthetase
MRRTKVTDAVRAEAPADAVLIQGWVRTRRSSKGVHFLELNDGSGPETLQVVVDADLPSAGQVEQSATGAAVSVEGALVESPGRGQTWELRAREVQLLGAADPEEYPLQKKRHSDEFLRSIAHLRFRSNKYGAVNRVRSTAALAVHDFFRERDFHCLHTPILTASDCEGAGELFKVTAQDPESIAEKGYSPEEDFFGKRTYLTVSGQLAAEAAACGLGQVYTFGPAFRAEDSNTPRHAAEFWMVEPEVAFAGLEEIVDLAGELLIFITGRVLSERGPDIELLSRFAEIDLCRRLEAVRDQGLHRLEYDEAVRILEQSGREWTYPVFFGADLQTEHERYLAEEHFRSPVAVLNYPREIKPFYMRENEDDRTVAGFDVLLPAVGEIVGGSQREERLEVLQRRMSGMGVDPADYEWYLDLRRYGSAPHAGFGLGFERLVMFLTGVGNIRDAIPFPRASGQLEY